VATGTVAHATKGAPLTRLQIEQWQLVSLVGAPSAVYRMKPQKQPPSIICITLSSAANISVHQRRRERHSHVRRNARVDGCRPPAAAFCLRDVKIA
jgi:hypothetical protein